MTVSQPDKCLATNSVETAVTTLVVFVTKLAQPRICEISHSGRVFQLVPFRRWNVQRNAQNFCRWSRNTRKKRGRKSSRRTKARGPRRLSMRPTPRWSMLLIFCRLIFCIAIPVKGLANSISRSILFCLRILEWRFDVETGQLESRRGLWLNFEFRLFWCWSMFSLASAISHGNACVLRNQIFELLLLNWWQWFAGFLLPLEYTQHEISTFA